MLSRRAPLLLALLLGCGPEPAPLTPPPPYLDGPASGPLKPSTTDTPPLPRFENPGGMWTPEQLVDHGKELASLGLEVPVASLSDPTKHPMGAIVFLGGCSASFVSPDGLIATNHHCSTGALQYSSTPQQNLLSTGWAAKTRADEKWNGPTSRVFVTQSFKDVTSTVRDGLARLETDLGRHEAIEQRQKKLIAECEKGRPGTRCNVVSYFGGGRYTLIEQLEIRDVRLVYAPDEGVGNYGGEIDNWRWPRHAGDFALFRAYVGKENKPADHSPDNVPYKPPHHLKIASKPLREGDLVMIAGYPGTTTRLKTAREVDEAVKWQYPRRINFCEEFVALLEGVGKTAPEVAIKANPTIRGLNNLLTKTRGLVEGLDRGGLAAKKAQLDADLAKWIDADPKRKEAYGDVLPKIATLVAAREKTREAAAAQGEAQFLVRMLGAATTIVRMAEERPKPDAERDPDFQERNWQRLEQEQVSMEKRYDRRIDAALLKLVLARSARLAPADRPPVFAAVIGPKAAAEPPKQDAIDKAVDALYAGSKVEETKRRVDALKGAKLADLKKSEDPFIKLAVALRPAQKAQEDRDEAFSGAMAMLAPRYVDALRTMAGGRLAPDANGTLRVTYGTVRGYRPKPDAPSYTPFTKLAEVVQKNTGKDPFVAPKRVLDAVKANRRGPWADAALGDVPVDFLSDLDITGGNSGSATLDARGDLVGLVFDHNIEAVASDWLFMPDITRSIHVDVRYLLWMLDAVDGGDHLLAEMGVKPAVD